MFQPPQAENRAKKDSDLLSLLATVAVRTVRTSISRAQVVVIRRVFGEFVVDESISIFLVKLVGLVYSVLVGMFELFPILSLDAFT
jgi:hypothetical protein